MTSPCPIEKFEDATELRLKWDYRKVRHDRFLVWFLVLFWIIWAPVTVFATGMIFRSGSPVFFSIWCVFGWVGTLGIPYALLQRSWSEWVTLSSEFLVSGQRGLLVPKPKHIPVSAVSQIGIGHYDPSDRESVVTLNINYITPK